MRLPHVVPFAREPIYFFTLCTAGRRPLLANHAALNGLSAVWQNSAQRDGWHVGRFVLMPDHAHFFAASARHAKSRAVWLKMLKSTSARRICAELCVTAPVWQPDSFDHILRSAESYSEKWEYVRQNPVRKGLVAKSDDWPWQGEIEPLKF